MKDYKMEDVNINLDINSLINSLIETYDDDTIAIEKELKKLQECLGTLEDSGLITNADRVKVHGKLNDVLWYFAEVVWKDIVSDYCGLNLEQRKSFYKKCMANKEIKKDFVDDYGYVPSFEEYDEELCWSNPQAIDIRTYEIIIGC